VEFSSTRIYTKHSKFFEDVRERVSSNVRSEYNADYSSIEIVLNDKSMNYKVVALDGSYNFV
jgi:hypothetical protein